MPADYLPMRKHWNSSTPDLTLCSERLSTPGYNVFESIPFSVFLERMDITWDSVGYDQLELLNKTDQKWMIEAWGEPSQHRSLSSSYSDIWIEYELKYERASR